MPRASYFDAICGAVSIANLTAMLNTALADPDVGSIVLDIDSPGGQVTGVHEFATRLKEASHIKPVQAYVSGMCASAAYWIATATGHITANKTAKIGSIGVVYAWTDDTVAKEKQGYKDYVVVSTQSPDKYLDPKTKDGRADLQRLADATAKIFIDDVAAYRGTKPKTVLENYGKGKVVLAEEALDAGMIDAVGVMDVVIDGLTGQRNEEYSMSRTPKAGARMQGKGKGKTKAEEEDEELDPTKDEEEDEDSAETNDEDEENEDTDPEDDEDDPAAKKPKGKTKTDKALANFKASYPDMYKAAFHAGVAKERARIKAIKDLGIVGHDDLVASAMFGNPMSAANLSMAVLKAENGVRKNLGKAYQDDAGDAFAKVDPIPSGASSGESAEELRAAKIMAGVK